MIYYILILTTSHEFLGGDESRRKLVWKSFLTHSKYIYFLRKKRYEQKFLHLGWLEDVNIDWLKNRFAWVVDGVTSPRIELPPYKYHIPLSSFLMHAGGGTLNFCSPSSYALLLSWMMKALSLQPWDVVDINCHILMWWTFKVSQEESMCCIESVELWYCPGVCKARQSVEAQEEETKRSHWAN